MHLCNMHAQDTQKDDLRKVDSKIGELTLKSDIADIPEVCI